MFQQELNQSSTHHLEFHQISSFYFPLTITSLPENYIVSTELCPDTNLYDVFNLSNGVSFVLLIESQLHIFIFLREVGFSLFIS